MFDGAPLSSDQTFILTNILIPYPYLFWLVVGLPFIEHAGGGLYDFTSFIAAFYLMLIGTKVVLIMLVSN